MTHAPLHEHFEMLVPGTAAGADFEAVVVVAPFAGTVTAATYITDTAITGANTDSRTISFLNKGLAGAGTTSVASKAFVSGTDSVAFDETAITLSSTAADLVVAEGDVLVFKSLHVGSTGLADPGGTARLTIART